MGIFPIIGKAPGGARLDRMRHSPNFRQGKFHNLVPTEIIMSGTSFFKMLKDYRNRPANTVPDRPLPSIRTDLRTIPGKDAWVVWFGHSSYLLKVEGLTILVDPVFSGNAAPVSFMARAFPGTQVYGVADMPPIDILLLTHDHYDHLDYRTVKTLIPMAGRIVTSLGVGADLEYWGADAKKIIELDWGEQRLVRFEEDKLLTITAAPARHFSGRSLKRGGTLWSSFVVKGLGHSLYLGGDSGYEGHFREIGDKHGPFELAILECGQYCKNWPFIHMLPEDTVRAALDLRATALLPVHWGKFTLSLHPWNEPVRRAVVAAEELGLSMTTPLIGQPVKVGGPYPAERWWEDK